MTDHKISDGERTQLIAGLEGLRAQIDRYPHAADGRSDELTTYFRSNTVPSVVCLGFRRIAEELREFQANKKKLVRTNRERMMALEALGKHAKEMASIVESMPDSNERLHLDLALGRVGMTVPAGPFEPWELQRVEHLKRMLGTVVIGVKNAIDVVTTDGKKGGRTESVTEYAGFVYMIAMASKDLSITPGRGGRFQELCTAIFAVAKVPASPLQAIRYYMLNYHATTK